MEITNCFAVPHAERDEEVAIGKDFNKQMLGLHLRANRKETVVGWYASTASGDAGEVSPGLIDDKSSLIHDFYTGETDDGDPIHLVVDTRLLTDSITARAYRCSPVVLQGEPLANRIVSIWLGKCSCKKTIQCFGRASTQRKKN